MNYAKIDSQGLIVDVAVADSADVFASGDWVECPEWLGIGLNINDPQPAPVEQPVVGGAQSL